MRSELGLALAMAARANAFGRGATGRIEVLAGHPTFARFHDLTFVRQTGLGGEVVANASVPWFRRMQNEGVGRIRLTLANTFPDRAPEGAWGLITEGDRGLELWTPTVSRRFAGHHDEQPLRLTVTSSRFDRWSLKPPLDVVEASLQLEEALKNAHQHLTDSGQAIAAGAIAKFITLHQAGVPDVDESLSTIAIDMTECAQPLFASGVRCLTLLEATGWSTASDPAARSLAEPLWHAIRVAFETAV